MYGVKQFLTECIQNVPCDFAFDSDEIKIYFNVLDLYDPPFITDSEELVIKLEEPEEEFIEAVQVVIDKDKQSGPAATAERESGFVYKRGN